MNENSAFILFLPVLTWSQELQFRLEPEAFPVTIYGWQPYCPWAGGDTEVSPALADIDNDGIWIFLKAMFGVKSPILVMMATI